MTSENTYLQNNPYLNYIRSFPITFLLILANIIMFIVLTLKGSSENILTLLDHGAKFSPLILAGQWWRFLTPLFLHIGISHLILNCASLLIAGQLVEGLYGKIRFLLIYFFSGFMGVCFSFLFSDAVSAGASGAIFGLFAAIVVESYFSSRLKQQFKAFGLPILAVTIINLVTGFFTKEVDNLGHIGGIAGGLLIALILRKRNWFNRSFTAFITVSFTATFLYFGYQQKPSNEEYLTSLSYAEAYVQKHQYQKARALLKPFLQDKKRSASVYVLNGVMDWQEEKIAQGREKFQKAIELDPLNDNAYYYLAVDAYYNQNDLNQAINLAKKAMEINPEQREYQTLLDELNATQ